MADPIDAGATLYPEGSKPEGNLGAAIDPATGKPKFSAPAAATPEVQAQPVEPKVEEPTKPAEAAPAEEKPAETKPEEAKPEEPKPPLDLAVYADLKLPEAFQVDEPTLNSFKEVAAKLNVPPEGAKELLDLYASVQTKQLEQLTAAANAETEKQNQTYLDKLNSMPEFQGEARERSLTLLGRMMDEFGSPELKEFVDSNPVGNHPMLVKYILDMGTALIEGEPTPIGSPGSLAGPKANGRAAPKTAGAILYGDSNAT